MSNSAACREVGIARRTGDWWRYGRTVTDGTGRKHTYPPITVEPPPEISSRFLSEDERIAIADLRRAGNSIRAIARELGRDPATISREVRRNADPHTGAYHPHRAQKRAVARRARSKEGKLRRNPQLREFVQQHLDQRWSPEQISRAAQVNFPDQPDMQVACETIYQALYRPERGGLDREPGKALRTRRAWRRRRRPGRRTTRFVTPGLMISQRPAEVADRSVPGHWEGDLIVGKNGGSAIGTLVERATRFTALVHLPGRHDADSMLDGLVRAAGTLPTGVVRSLTWDQGGEMALHGQFTAATGIPVYFCEPASPWQRGSNENTNGLLRQYFPKSTDLSIHTADDLAAVAAELNNRPRKALDWATPAQRFANPEYSWRS
ncbi:IS30 family transposase [Kibdelosporangium philippinense]